MDLDPSQYSEADRLRRGKVKAPGICTPGAFFWGVGRDAARVRAVPTAQHGTSAGWHSGCRCTLCRLAHSDTQRAWKRARAQGRLPTDVRRQLLDAIYDRKPLRQALRDLGLTPNQVWGLAKTDDEWSEQLEAALMATRRDDLQHGTNATVCAAVSATSAVSTSASGWRGNLSSSPRNELPAPMD